MRIDGWMLSRVLPAELFPVISRLITLYERWGVVGERRYRYIVELGRGGLGARKQARYGGAKSPCSAVAGALICRFKLLARLITQIPDPSSTMYR